MLDFLKRFGLGILYVLISPFVIAFLLLWAVYGLGSNFIELIRAFGSFFKGKKFFTPFPEDEEAKRILSLEPYANNQDVNTNTPAPEQTPPPTNENQNNDGGNPTL